MSILLICILWTWGLTPLWVNILGTVILGLRFLFGFANMLSVNKDYEYKEYDE